MLNKICLIDIILIEVDNMEDENKVLSILKVVFVIIIVGIIALIAYLVVSHTISSSNKNKLEDYFKKQGFSEKNGVWSKDEQEEIGDIVSNVSYNYTPNINKYSKEIKNNAKSSQEQLRFKYNGNDNISVIYSFNGTEGAKNCMLTQDALFNYKTNDFTCNVKYNPSDCMLHCNTIKSEAQKFSNELKNVLNDSDVNTLFLDKNKD